MEMNVDATKEPIMKIVAHFISNSHIQFTRM